MISHHKSVVLQTCSWNVPCNHAGRMGGIPQSRAGFPVNASSVQPPRSTTGSHMVDPESTGGDFCRKRVTHKWSWPGGSPMVTTISGSTKDQPSNALNGLATRKTFAHILSARAEQRRSKAGAPRGRSSCDHVQHRGFRGNQLVMNGW